VAACSPTANHSHQALAFGQKDEPRPSEAQRYQDDSDEQNCPDQPGSYRVGPAEPLTLSA
jgi:hypothetical protein